MSIDGIRHVILSIRIGPEASLLQPHIISCSSTCETDGKAC